MSSTVPDFDELARAKLAEALRYVRLGWKVFVLGRDKTPLPNCSECKDADWTHDRETCDHPTCHGFYAATDSTATLVMMITRYPDGWLAVRTGQASRLLVLDFEAAPDAEGRHGSPEEFELWTGVELPGTIMQRTQSGGIHLLYQLSPGVVVKSRNRILPQTDVKAEGGYVAVPTPGRPERAWGSFRSWVLPEVVFAPYELLTWLLQARGKAITTGDGGRHDTPSISVYGYDFHRFLRDGCPGGARDQFFNELIFRARKAGKTREAGERIARVAWEMCEQPPNTEWYMPWEHVTYKLDRVWQTVAPPVLPSWRPTATSQDDATTGRVRPRILRLGETA